MKRLQVTQTGVAEPAEALRRAVERLVTDEQAFPPSQMRQLFETVERAKAYLWHMVSKEERDRRFKKVVTQGAPRDKHESLMHTAWQAVEQHFNQKLQSEAQG